MVTQRQRIAVTLSDEARDLVQRLAALNESAGAGRYSAAGVVAELIEAQVPMLRQLVELGEQARALTDEQRARVMAMADELEPELMASAEGALDAWNKTLDTMRQVHADES